MHVLSVVGEFGKSKAIYVQFVVLASTSCKIKSTLYCYMIRFIFRNFLKSWRNAEHYMRDVKSVIS